MNPKKVLLGATGATLVLFGAGSLLASQVAAATAGDDLVSAIAAHFNVDESEVQQIFDDVHEQRQDARLDEFVTNGDLTQEQRDALESKQDELRVQMDAVLDSDMTDEEKRDAMRELHESMRDWLDEQGIELPRPQRGISMRGGGPGFGGGMML